MRQTITPKADTGVGWVQLLGTFECTSLCRGTAGAGVPAIYSVMGSSLSDNFCRTVSMHKAIFKSKRLFTIKNKL